MILTTRHDATSLIFIALMLIFPAQVSHAQEIILSTKRSILIGEPVVLHIDLRNTGDRPWTFSPQLRMDTRVLRYEMSSDGASFKHIKHFSMADASSAKVALEPGETLRHNETLFVQWPGFTETRPYRMKPSQLLIQEPGDYFFRVSMRGSEQRIESNTVRVQVSEPTEPADRRALETLRRHPELIPAIYFLRTTPWSSAAELNAEEMAEILTALAESDAAIAPHAALALASGAVRRSREEQRTETAAERRERFEESLRWLRRADQDGFPLRRLAIYQMARMLDKLGEKDAAKRGMRRVVEHFPLNTDMRERAERMLGEVVEGPERIR